MSVNRFTSAVPAASSETGPIDPIVGGIPNAGTTRVKVSSRSDLSGKMAELQAASSGTDDYLNAALVLISETMGASRAAIFTRETVGSPMRIRAKLGVAVEDETLLPRLAKNVITTGTPVASDGPHLLEIDRSEVGETPSKAFVGVPLITGRKVYGALVVGPISAGDELKGQVGFLETVGGELAVVLERERVELAVRESEFRYRMLFDHAPDGIIILDISGRILDVNASFCRLLGYTHAEVMRLSQKNLLAESEIEMVPTALKALAESNRFQREWKFLRRSGEVVEVDVSATRMPDGNILAVVRDLSEYRKAELEKKRLADSLLEHKRRLDNIVANVPGIVWETKLTPTGDRVGTFVSDYLTSMLGYSTEEWLSTPNFWSSIVHPDHQRKLADRTDAFPAGETRVREVPLIAKDGRTVWVESQSASVPGEFGEVAGIRGVMIDITDRKRSEHALRNSEERYRDLVENAIDIIYVHDLNGNYISVNKAAERITGYSRSEMIGMNMAQTVAPEFLEKAREMMAAKIAGNEVTAYELEIIAKDGRRVALEVNTRLMCENGIPVSVQGIARDVTERKLLEDKYRQSQKMEAVGLLAGGIAHDFNNLLTAITGYSEITLSKMAADDPLRPNVEEIRETGERAAALTRQLLAFSRKQVLKPVVHSINDVIRGLEKMLRRLIPENITFHFDLEDGIDLVEADPGQLGQVFMNLALNAQDAMPDGGVLTVLTRSTTISQSSDEGRPIPSGKYVKIVVSDTGEGIDESIRDRIFEPFFTTKEPGKGSGLGLSTVHGIVKQSGGEISARSRKGLGSSFEVFLPAAKGSSTPAERSENIAAAAPGRETVLLVEDDPTVRKLVVEILTGRGYRVLEAEDGATALVICNEYSETIHLLLTDLVMPIMGGIELAEKIGELRPQIKPLVMTGYSKDPVELNLLSEPHTPILNKPFTPSILLSSVRQVLKTANP